MKGVRYGGDSLVLRLLGPFHLRDSEALVLGSARSMVSRIVCPDRFMMTSIRARTEIPGVQYQ